MSATPLNPETYPLINGIRYDWSSVEIKMAGIVLPIIGVTALDYEAELDPGVVYGTKAAPQGRTRGQYKPTASIELYLYEGYFLIQQLQNNPNGLGYMEQPFLITPSYGDFGQPTITDLVKGCRIKKHAVSHKEGSEALHMKFDLSVMSIWPNQLPPIGGMTP